MYKSMSFRYASNNFIRSYIYSEKATKFCKISTVDLTGTTKDKFTVEISQNFVTFSEYMNFNIKITRRSVSCNL